VTVLTDTDEGAGIAFRRFTQLLLYDDAGVASSQVCVVSRDGGMTWSQPAAFGFGDKTASWRAADRASAGSIA